MAGRYEGREVCGITKRRLAEGTDGGQKTRLRESVPCKTEEQRRRAGERMDRWVVGNRRWIRGKGRGMEQSTRHSRAKET